MSRDYENNLNIRAEEKSRRPKASVFTFDGVRKVGGQQGTNTSSTHLLTSPKILVRDNLTPLVVHVHVVYEVTGC